jgi:hypothetical protein
MNVPIAQRTEGIDAQAAPNVSIKPITEGAFGADVARSNMNIAEAKGSIGKAIGGVGQQLFEHMAAKRGVEREQASNDMVSDFAKEAGEKVIYGKDGVFNRFGVNAKGSTEYADAELSKLQATYLKNMDAESADHFKRKSGAIISTWRESYIPHEVKESRIADEQGVNASIKTSADVSSVDGLSTPPSQALFNTALSEARDLTTRQGMGKEASDIYVERVAGAYVGTVIDANINNNPDKARKALEFAKGKLSTESYKAFDIKITANEFSKAVSVGKAAGMGLDEVLTKYANNPEFNKHNEETKAELYSIARKAYAVTDYHTYNALADGIEAGTIKQSDIDAKFDAGRIIQSDAESLSERLRRGNTGEAGGKLPLSIKLAVDGLKLKAAEKFKTKQEEDEFMFVVNQEARKNTTPEQLYKKGLDLMEMGTIPTAHFWTNEDYPNYKIELERQRATDVVKAVKMDNATNWLLENNERVTPANIEAVIAWKEKQVKK